MRLKILSRKTTSCRTSCFFFSEFVFDQGYILANRIFSKTSDTFLSKLIGRYCDMSARSVSLYIGQIAEIFQLVGNFPLFSLVWKTSLRDFANAGVFVKMMLPISSGPHVLFIRRPRRVSSISFLEMVKLLRFDFGYVCFCCICPLSMKTSEKKSVGLKTVNLNKLHFLLSVCAIVFWDCPFAVTV